MLTPEEATRVFAGPVASFFAALGLRHMDTLRTMTVDIVDRAQMAELSKRRGEDTSAVFGVTVNTKEERTVSTEKGTTKLVTGRSVDTIALLSHVPRAFAYATLAHELGHAYMHLEKFPHLAPIDEEGIWYVV